MLAFTTDAFRPAERFDAFNEEFARRVMLIDASRRDEGPFHGEIDVRLIGPLVCARMNSSSVDFRRARSNGGDGSVVLGIHLSGRFQLRRRETIWDSRDDFASLMTDDELADGRFEGEALTVRIPRALLANHLDADLISTAARIRRNSPLARLLGPYLATYLSLPPNADRELGDATGRHIVDLVALAMGAAGDATEVIGSGGLRAARRQAVLDEIKKGYLISGLTAEAVARAVGISERYLRQLLEELGTTFTDLVLERRLDGARQMLIDPALGHKRITDVAYDAGFSDLSYFNRAFRRRYSATPRDVRAAALGY